jgi:senataxin
MHPEISELPSQVFYSGRLLDGPGMAEKTKRPWHNSPIFPPYQFFNVSGQESQADRGSSLVNRQEVDVAVALFSRLQREFSNIDFSFRVGVVSMYRAQIQAMRNAFRVFGADIVETIDFNTVDGFQGQEKDIIILSCVRASPGGSSVGFLAGESLHSHHGLELT